MAKEYVRDRCACGTVLRSKNHTGECALCKARRLEAAGQKTPDQGSGYYHSHYRPPWLGMRIYHGDFARDF